MNLKKQDIVVVFLLFVLMSIAGMFLAINSEKQLLVGQLDQVVNQRGIEKIEEFSNSWIIYPIKGECIVLYDEKKMKTRMNLLQLVGSGNYKIFTYSHYWKYLMETSCSMVIGCFLYIGIMKIFNRFEKSAKNTVIEMKKISYHEAAHLVVGVIACKEFNYIEINIIDKNVRVDYTSWFGDYSTCISSMAMFLAGGLCTEQNFNNTYGNGRDVFTSNLLAAKAVIEEGYSADPKLRFRVFGSFDENNALHYFKPPSAEEQKLIDQEIAEMIRKSEILAKKIIDDNRNKIDKLAYLLQQKKKLEKAEISQFLQENEIYYDSKYMDS